MKERKLLKEAILIYYNQLVNNYEVREYEDEVGKEVEYVFTHKETEEVSIQLYYSLKEPSIEIRHLTLDAISLIKKSNDKSLKDFINLSLADMIKLILYIDIKGNPNYYYSSTLSNKEHFMLKLVQDEEAQAKFVAILAEMKLALNFSGLLYLKNHT